MKQIELSIWEAVPGKPGMVRKSGMRTAQEVFAELEHRLESTGYLPDEYFLLDSYWRDGIEIPNDAFIFCTAEYGASEGIYLNVYLRWYDEKASVTKCFATGKTLDNTENYLDRMHLIASAVNKAFYSDGSHARYIHPGEEKPQSTTIHLNETERKIMINSLVETRNQLKSETENVEQLLRRVTGNITEFINEAGERPLKINSFDRAVLAVHDGNLLEFNENIPTGATEQGELLEIAAGRPGTVGRKMVISLLGIAQNIPYDSYLTACKNAISAADTDRVLVLADMAEQCITQIDMSLYGKIISFAMLEHKSQIAEAVLDHCTAEQINHADPHVLEQAIWNDKYQIINKLVKKGIDGNSRAAELINTLANKYRGNLLNTLFDLGLNIENDNYSALHACIERDNFTMGTLLLDRGMSFEGYTEWCENNSIPKIESEAFNALEEYWENEYTNNQDESFGQTMSSM